MTTTKTMSVQQALRELALTAKKVDDKRARADLVACVPANQATVKGKPVAEYNADADSSWDSLRGLLNYHTALKRAINLSNASTFVEIGNTKMTVAEAIARKDTIEVEFAVLHYLDTQITRAMKEAQSAETALFEQATKAATALYGDKDKEKTPKADYDKFVKDYVEARTPVLVGLKDATKIRDEMKAELDLFQSEVDWKLTESNVQTLINVEI